MTGRISGYYQFAWKSFVVQRICNTQSQRQSGGTQTGAPTYFLNSQPSASSLFCSSGVSLAIPMPVAAQRSAKKIAIQFEIAHGM